MGKPKTVRLVFPQWQGGYDETEYPGQIYAFGSYLLQFLAPATDDVVREVPVPKWHEGIDTPKEGGVFYRTVIMNQMQAARDILLEERPERVVTFGGDCLVSQPAFDYLNELYDGEVGLLWIDAHPDVTTPRDFDHSHAMVLGNLLNDGEPEMAKMVGRHFSPSQILYVGVDNVLDHERATMDQFGLKQVTSRSVMASSAEVVAWLKETGFKRVIVHWDLDVLDPEFFRSLLFVNPDMPEPIESELGKLRLSHVARVLRDVEAACDIVGLTISEFMPWDALNLKKVLAGLKILN